ncbi:MAG: ABC transporter ATP-binding protein, partial [Pseudomonadota bacterium]|nr:ABC transporter ATP-binding protein [Pseudomonadota bacterium]
EALDKANRETGTTTVIITHNASIAGMADRVITLSDGNISGERLNERRQDPRTLSW